MYKCRTKNNQHGPNYQTAHSASAVLVSITTISRTEPLGVLKPPPRPLIHLQYNSALSIYCIRKDSFHSFNLRSSRLHTFGHPADC